MPALEMAQETGKVLRWIKSPGDRVVKGESIVEIETDKVTVEIEAPASGILRDVSAQAGDVVPVGKTIALIFAAGEAGATSSRPAAAPAAASPPRRPRRGAWRPSAESTSRSFAARVRAAPSSPLTSALPRLRRRRKRGGPKPPASAPSGASWPSA